jgi:hypothetical protein
MGLLDEAIRDHLELKRRRGADPGEVAREQREALPDGGASGEPTAPSASGDEEPSGALAGGEQGALERETAELDMSTVLAGDVEATESVAEEDSLTWETPDRGGAPRTGDASPQAGLD